MGGIWPFLQTGELRDLAGEVLMAEVPCTVFDSNQFSSEIGEAYDSTATVSARAAEHLVDKANRRLSVDGKTYTVVSTLHHRQMGYLECALKRSLAN
jgi:hypothetical protein